MNVEYVSIPWCPQFSDSFYHLIDEFSDDWSEITEIKIIAIIS